MIGVSILKKKIDNSINIPSSPAGLKIENLWGQFNFITDAIERFPTISEDFAIEGFPLVIRIGTAV